MLTISMQALKASDHANMVDNVRAMTDLSDDEESALLSLEKASHLLEFGVLPVKGKNSRLDNTVKAGEARLTCLDVTTIYIYIYACMCVYIYTYICILHVHIKTL